MFVRLTHGRYRPDCVPELRRIFAQEIKPTVKQQKGHLFLYLLEDTQVEGVGLFVSAWESEADHQATWDSGFYGQMMDKVKHLFSEAPVAKFYRAVE